MSVLVDLDVVKNGLLVVEGAISLGEGAARPQGNADTRGLDDGVRRSEESKSYRNQGYFAEHRGEAGRGWRSWAGRAGDPDGQYSSLRPA